MKSFERRIQKLEDQFNTKDEEKIIILLHKHYSSKYDEIHKGVCSYGEGENCPLYKDKYKEAKKNNQSGTIYIMFPCFKDGECPLCIESFSTPTSERDKSSKNEKPKNKEGSNQNKSIDPFKKIKKISEVNK